MRIEIGAAVMTNDGKDVGKVNKAIIDPLQNKVTHLVIETGFLMGRLIVVPAAAVKRTKQHELWLKLSPQELHEMPDFIETEYAAPPRGWEPPLGYLPGTVLWPGGYTYMPVLVEEEKNVPPDSIEVYHETEVFALDGKIGVVDQVVVNSRSKKVIGYIVCKDEGLPESVFIPICWIAAAGDMRLSLNRTKAEIIDKGNQRAAA